MPLYWYTDKPIGKYRLKKPIPIRFDIKLGIPRLWMFNIWGDPVHCYKDDERIRIIKQRLDDQDKEVTGKIEQEIKERDAEFIRQLMEYLEEI